MNTCIHTTSNLSFSLTFLAITVFVLTCSTLHTVPPLPRPNSSTFSKSSGRRSSRNSRPGSRSLIFSHSLSYSSSRRRTDDRRLSGTASGWLTTTGELPSVKFLKLRFFRKGIASQDKKTRKIKGGKKKRERESKSEAPSLLLLDTDNDVLGPLISRPVLMLFTCATLHYYHHQPNNPPPYFFVSPRSPFLYFFLSLTLSMNMNA